MVREVRQADRQGSLATGTPGPGSEDTVGDHSAPAGGRVRLRAGLTWVLALAVGIGAFGVIDGPGMPAPARTAYAADPDDRKDEIDAQIEKARESLVDLSADTQDALLALRRTQLATPQAQRRVTEAQARIGTARTRARQLAAGLTEAKQDEQAGLEALARIAKETVAAEDHRNAIARSAYEGDGIERFALVLGAESATTMSERLYYLEKVSDHQQELLRGLAAKRRTHEAEQARLEDARRRIAQLSLQAEANVAEAQAAGAVAARATAELARLAAQQKSQLAVVASKRKAEQRRLDSLQQESDRLAAILAELERKRMAAEAARRAKAEARARAAAARAGRAEKTRARRAQENGADRRQRRSTAPSVPSSAPGQRTSGATLAVPVNGPTTSEFGLRFHPILHRRKMHTGLDFGAPCGSPVRASAAGVIVRAGWAGGYGNQVVIAHSGPLATTYNHLSGIARRSGSVARGDVIGYVGTTGLSTGCHLHYEARVGGALVNPRRFL